LYCKDKVILHLGKKLFGKNGVRQARIVRNNMRILENLLMKTNEVAGRKDLTGEDILHHINFVTMSEGKLSLNESCILSVWCKPVKFR
jgi:hypothetical protein